MSWLALDIGGANLKAADGRGFATTHGFALWRQPQGLAAALGELVERAPQNERIAVTMTGELADCYPSRADGVQAIAAAAEEAAAGRELHFYRNDGQWTAGPPEGEWLAYAASNWRALAQWSLRLCAGEPGLLVDIGSTTVDLIPLATGRVAATGRDDYGRLRSGELVYAGVERTPLCAVIEAAHLDDGECPVAAELFATTMDAYLTLAELPEDGEAFDTADGRPRTRAAARGRLGRMVCRELNDDEAHALALQVKHAQLQRLEQAARAVLDRMLDWPTTVVVSGHGDFLAGPLLERLDLGPSDARVVSLSRELGPAIARCGPAHALAVLAEEALGA